MRKENNKPSARGISESSTRSARKKKLAKTSRVKRKPKLSDDDLSALTILAGFNAPPKLNIAKVKANRKAAKLALRQFQRSAPDRTTTTEDLIRDQILLANPGVDANSLPRTLRGLLPLIKKFDWRAHKIVPFVRNQGTFGNCWAYVSTQAFESSLMHQRVNFATPVSSHISVVPSKISLNVKSTLDCVQSNGDRGGRHEHAFDHYVKSGIPLSEIGTFRVSDRDPRDFNLKKGHCTENEKTGVKALAWDYVHLPPHRVPPTKKLKEALLLHGPLVVMLVFDNAFRRYGVRDKNDVAPVFETKTRGLGFHYVLLLGWDDDKVVPGDPLKRGSWIIQNSFGTKWGYSCDGCEVMSGDNRCEDRGFMYIRWGSNEIGQFAAWVAAPLLDNRQLEEIANERLPRRARRASQSAKKLAGKKKT